MTACETFVEQLPEFVLDVAPAEDRAAIVDHVGGCVECTQRVAAWRATVDRCLAAGPAVEPPPGFESRALASFSTRGEPRRSRRVLALAAVVVLLAGVGAGALAALRQTSDDRALADVYRAQLDEADGRYFAARKLTGATGSGVAFVYEGDPSWVLVTVRDMPGAASVVVTATTGATFGGSLDPAGGTLSFGSAIPFHAYEIATVTIVDGAGTTLLTGTIHA